MIKSFDDIYKKNIWTTGSSGSGSNFTKTNQKLINEINEFIKSNNILNVADYGCGDFKIMKYLDFKNISYYGYDKVDFIINKNNEENKNDNIKFINSEEIPKGFDLVIVKDVLQHHQDEDVIKYLNELINNNKYVYCINGYKFMRDPDKNIWMFAISITYIDIILFIQLKFLYYNSTNMKNLNTLIMQKNISYIKNEYLNHLI